MFMNPFPSRARLSLGMLLASGIIATGVQADELPMRKAGLWEMKMITNSMNITSRDCTSPAVEKETREEAMSYEDCSQQEIRKTATGYIVDAICQTDDGKKMATHMEVIGDFDSAYTTKHSERVSGKLKTTVTIQAKWLGACPSGWKPGDIKMDMPGDPRLKGKSEQRR